MLNYAKRIVIKVGSSLMTDEADLPRKGWLESLAADGAGATNLNTIHGTQKGTHYAFS